ncbi:MAG: 50S ribosomal protein L17 [Candidatus Omnitrophota bacterium]
MRHQKARYRLNRFTSWRKATLKSIARNILIHQSIKTTLNKAKAAQPLVEGLITLSKAGTLVAKRESFKILGAHRLVKLLFEEVGPRFAGRQSGYTRVINLGQRRGDNAKLVIFELTEIKKKEKRPRKKKKLGRAESEMPAPQALTQEGPAAEKKAATQAQVKQKPPLTKKPAKNFLGGIKNIFKKKSDSL